MGCTRKPIRVSIRVSERVSKRVSKDSIRVSTRVLEGFRLGFHAMTSYKKELIHTVLTHVGTFAYQDAHTRVLNITDQDLESTD